MGWFIWNEFVFFGEILIERSLQNFKRIIWDSNYSSSGCQQVSSTNNDQKVRPKLELRRWFIFCLRNGVPKAHESAALLRGSICHCTWQKPLKLKLMAFKAWHSHVLSAVFAPVQNKLRIANLALFLPKALLHETAWSETCKLWWQHLKDAFNKLIKFRRSTSISVEITNTWQ